MKVTFNHFFTFHFHVTLQKIHPLFGGHLWSTMDLKNINTKSIGPGQESEALCTRHGGREELWCQKLELAWVTTTGPLSTQTLLKGETLDGLGLAPRDETGIYLRR